MVSTGKVDKQAVYKATRIFETNMGATKDFLHQLKIAVKKHSEDKAKQNVLSGAKVKLCVILAAKFQGARREMWQESWMSDGDLAKHRRVERSQQWIPVLLNLMFTEPSTREERNTEQKKE